MRREKDPLIQQVRVLPRQRLARGGRGGEEGFGSVFVALALCVDYVNLHPVRRNALVGSYLPLS